MKSPTAKQIKQSRASIGLTQTQAAHMLHCSMRTWQEWEGKRTKMHPAFWELWNIKLQRMSFLSAHV